MSEFAKAAKMILANFTEEEPLMVPPHIHTLMMNEPDLADLMGRVRIQQLMPTKTFNETPPNRRS